MAQGEGYNVRCIFHTDTRKMKGLLFFLVLLGIITVAWSFSTKEGFQDTLVRDPGLNIPLISPRYQTLVKGEVLPFSPPSTSLLAPPPGQSASVNTRPDSDPAMQKVTAERIQSIYESIVGFFANDATGLQKIGDPSIQLPLTTTRGDRIRLKDELDTLKRNPGLESSLTIEDVDGIQANLGYLQKKWRMSTNALSGSPMEGFQSGSYSGSGSGSANIPASAYTSGSAATIDFQQTAPELYASMLGSAKEAAAPQMAAQMAATQMAAQQATQMAAQQAAQQDIPQLIADDIPQLIADEVIAAPLPLPQFIGTGTSSGPTTITGESKPFRYGDKGISITGPQTVTIGVPAMYTVSPVTGYPDWDTNQALVVILAITDPTGNETRDTNARTYTFNPTISGKYRFVAHASMFPECLVGSNDASQCPTVSMTVNVINGASTTGGTTTGGSIFGGSATGGSIFGGSTTGGSIFGGSTTGGSILGGSSFGPTTGGSTTGGSSFGPSTGGSILGGSSFGPTTGGSSFGPTTGGSSFGGSSFGPTTGGSSFGGSSFGPTTGGSSFGGSSFGPTTGGSSFGGSSFGGSSFGGSITDSIGSDVTLKDLEDLSMRIGIEILRLQSSGAADAFVDMNLQSRINTLITIKKLVDDLIAEVKSGARKLKDVPLTKADIARFLPAMVNRNTALPDLIKGYGASNYLNSLFPTFAAGDISGAVLAQKLFNKYEDQLINNLSWDVSLSYTSKAEQKVAADNAMTAGRYGYIPENHTSPYTMADKGGYRGFFDSLVNNIRHKGDTSSSSSYSSSSSSPSSYSSPSSSSSPSSYRSSSSSSSSKPGNHGSLDWKDRSKQICGQIKARGYDPYEFGCLQNPDAMNRESFSWRGYTKMVCNRLSTVYDSSVPELCGCPPTDWPGWRQ